MKIDFGRNYREKFGYLIVTAILMFICSSAVVMFGKLTCTDEYFASYGLFYTLTGAVVGFVTSQLFIRQHTKSVRRGMF